MRCLKNTFYTDSPTNLSVNAGGGGAEGTAGLVISQDFQIISESDSQCQICIRLDLSQEISYLGCPLNVTLSILEGSNASKLCVSGLKILYCYINLCVLKHE